MVLLVSIDEHYRNQLYKRKPAMCKPLLLLHQSFKAVEYKEYSNTKYFIYKDRSGLYLHNMIKVLKKELAWVTNKWLLVISSLIVIKQLYQ